MSGATSSNELAKDRKVMAMERTIAGWIRTAFAAIGIGLAFRAVCGDFQPPRRWARCCWLPGYGY